MGGAVALLAMAVLPCHALRGAVPAGGATSNAGVGVGSGATEPLVQERAAPAGSVLAGGGGIDAPAITLNENGDWSVFVATLAPPPSVKNLSGTVLSIGTPSASLFTDPGQLSISWCASFDPKTWAGGIFGGAFVATGKDDSGKSVSTRNPNAPFFGVAGVKPLVGLGGMNDSRAHGLAVQCRGGVVEFWSVDETGARLMDQGAVNAGFKGITGKPLRIGAAQVAAQPNPSTLWKQPVQCVVINNGGCLTPVQMKRLWSGADARDVVDLQASRDDRYYPGTLHDGMLHELVSGKHGVISGAAASPAILPAAPGDDVIVDMDGGGQVLPRDPPPATTTRARFWGTRIGGVTDIRLRVVKADAPIPAGAADVVADWVTVAAGVKNGQTWIGEVPGIPHEPADYDCEVSWKNARGGWTPPRRLNRRWALGVVVGIGGQSIVQRMRDDQARPARTYDQSVGPFLRAYYNIAQGTAGYQDQTQTQGWTGRRTVNTAYFFGELRMAERLALLTKSAVGVGNFAVGGSPISGYLGNTERWLRWKEFIRRNRPQIGIWGNGQGDQGMTKAKRFAALDQLLEQYDEAVRTSPGGPWNYQFYVYPMNGDWSNNGDAIRSHDFEWAASRAAQGKPVGVLCFTLDTETQDGIHLADNDAGLGVLAGRMAQTVAYGVGLAPFSGLGPEFDRSSSTWSVQNGVTTAKLALKQNGGSALVTVTGTGSPSGFKISIDGGPFVAPDGASIADATHIVLTSTVAAQNRVSVTYLSGYPGTVNLGAKTTKTDAGLDNAVYDNRGDAISGLPGFPVSPILGANPLELTK